MLQYLHGTRTLKLHLNTVSECDGINVTAYSDADFASDKIDRKCLCGTIVRVNGALIGWNTKKQSTVALFTMEAEYAAATVAIQDLLWTKHALEECGLPVQTPMLLRVDNQAAITQLNDESSSCKAKHVDVKLKFAKDHITRGDIKPKFVDTANQVADISRKPSQPRSSRPCASSWACTDAKRQPQAIRPSWS